MVHRQSRSSPAASAQQPLPKSTATTSLALHHRLWAPVFPVDPTAILQAPRVPSVTTALQAQALVAVHVNAMVSLVEAIVSSWIVVAHAVVTVTILALAVHLILRRNISLEAPEDTDLLSDDDPFDFSWMRREATAVHSLRRFQVCKPTPTASRWS